MMCFTSATVCSLNTREDGHVLLWRQKKRKRVSFLSLETWPEDQQTKQKLKKKNGKKG